MGDADPVECVRLLYFPMGINSDTPSGAAEFADVLQAPTCCHFRGIPAT